VLCDPSELGEEEAKEYSIGKVLRLPSLIFVLLFGLRVEEVKEESIGMALRLSYLIFVLLFGFGSECILD